MAAADRLLKIANTPEYRDKSPKQLVPLLADQGIFIASERSFYRVLKRADQPKHREPSKPPTKRHRPDELDADGPCQVWSRKIVGFEVHAEENAEHAANLIDGICAAEAVSKGQLTLHSDNGRPMKGATMLAMLQGLGVAASLSRPSVSNDNPYSESLFRTVKFRPNYSKRPLASIEEARAWSQKTRDWTRPEEVTSTRRRRRRTAHAMNSGSCNDLGTDRRRGVPRDDLE